MEVVGKNKEQMEVRLEKASERVNALMNEISHSSCAAAVTSPESWHAWTEGGGWWAEALVASRCIPREQLRKSDQKVIRSPFVIFVF
jgi:hypothetical protein